MKNCFAFAISMISCISASASLGGHTGNGGDGRQEIISCASSANPGGTMVLIFPKANHLEASVVISGPPHSGQFNAKMRRETCCPASNPACCGGDQTEAYVIESADGVFIRLDFGTGSEEAAGVIRYPGASEESIMCNRSRAVGNT